MEAKMLRLSDAARSLHIPYQSLYFAVDGGLVPAERDATGNRWLVKESDLPLIAERLAIEDYTGVGPAQSSL